MPCETCRTAAYIDGELVYVETKLRESTNLTKNQKFVYEMREQGKAFFTGRKATKAELKGKAEGVVQQVYKKE